MARRTRAVAFAAAGRHELAWAPGPEIEPRTGKPKHFEQVAFERWLDANPNGTTLLLDTIDVYMGAVHAAMAGKTDLVIGIQSFLTTARSLAKPLAACSR